ncbi:hypothetical protein DITRI_Ditri09bG0009000 [Diplodiscus trichospermus]
MEMQNWFAEVNQRVEYMTEDASTEAEKWRKLSIYKVPTGIRGGNAKGYKPQIVSLGPYHHGEAHLIPMETHKQRALLHFLKRSNTPFEAFVFPVAQVLEDIMDSYYELDASWQNDRDRFLRLMIVDGIFMLEVLASAVHGLNYTNNDPIFSWQRKQPFLSLIKRDMLMLENQLPLLVLVKLVMVESNNTRREEFVIKSLISPFFFPSPIRSDLNIGTCLHILDVCRKILVFEEPLQNMNGPVAPSYSIVLYEDHNVEIPTPHATMLNAAGIRFEENKTRSRSLKDVSFNFNILRLPRIVVDHATETLFLNLVAFERLDIKAGSEVTSFMAFMNIIIKDENDIRFLTSPGIITKANVSDHTLFELFRSLPKDITIDPESSLTMVRKRINLYYKRPWIFQLATMRLSPEFKDPVKAMSIVIAYAVLPLTLLQTVYAVLGYSSQAE